MVPKDVQRRLHLEDRSEQGDSKDMVQEEGEEERQHLEGIIAAAASRAPLTGRKHILPEQVDHF